MGTYVGTAEAARRLGYNQDYVQRLCQKKKLPAIKIFSDWRIKVEDLEALVKRRSGE
jgi:excisionase family DNA binding protein